MTRLRIIICSILVMISFITVYSFTSAFSNTKAYASLCWKYIGPEPPNIFNLANPLNWVLVPCSEVNSCLNGNSICIITFDPNVAPIGYSYSLDPNGKPNSTVLNVIGNNASSTLHGASIYQNGQNMQITVWKKEIE